MGGRGPARRARPVRRTHSRRARFNASAASKSLTKRLEAQTLHQIPFGDVDMGEGVDIGGEARRDVPVAEPLRAAGPAELLEVDAEKFLG